MSESSYSTNGPSWGRRVFLANADSLLGRSLGPALAALGCEVLGSYYGQTAPGYVSNGYQVGTSTAEAAKRQLLAVADAVICELYGYEQTARDILVHMTKQPWGGRQQCYIGVSTPLVWAATRPPSPVPLDEDFLAPTSAAPSRPMSGKHDHTDHAETASTTSALPDGMALEGGSKPATAPDAYASAAAFGALTDKDAPRRAPCLAARDVHEVEQLILRSGRKNKLRTYVVCPGLLYGCGEEEEGLHPLMRTAWEVAGPLTIYGPGTNHLPMVHVEDAASYIAAVASAEAMTALPESLQYLVVTDGSVPGEPGGVEQGVLVRAVAGMLGKGEVTELPSEELLFAKGGAGQVDRWTLGTKLATTPLPPSLPRPAPKYAAGIMAHFEAVVQQWRQVRGVTPLRVVLAGPPMSGKSVAGARIAAAYRLRHISAKDILAAAPLLGPEEGKVLAAEMGSKEPHASAKSMAALLRCLLMSDKGADNRGYVLDGWPRTAPAARWAFMKLAELSEGEKAAAAKEAAALVALQASKDTKGTKGGAGKSASGAGGAKKEAKSGKPSTQEPGPDVPEGLKLVPDPGTAPTHLIELSAPEDDLKARMKAVEAAELEAARLASPPLDAKQSKGKDKGVSVQSHNNDKDFQRRMEAFIKLGAEDEAELAEQVAAMQERFEALAAAAAAERAAAEAEASTLRAKRKKAREMAAAAAAGGGSGAEGGAGDEPGTPSPAAPHVGGSTGPVSLAVTPRDPTMSLEASLMAALASQTGRGAADSREPGGPEGPKLPRLPGLAGVVVEACGAIYHKLANPNRAEGGPPTENEAWRTVRLPALESALAAVLGAPHNFEGTPADDLGGPSGSVRAESIGSFREADATAAAADAAKKRTGAEAALAAAEEEAAAQFAASMELRQAYVGAPVKRFLMASVMPTVCEALALLARDRPEEPLRFLAHHLLQEAERREARYTDPYTDPVYQVQLDKIAAKAARDAAREEAAAAKAEKELAAKQAARAAEEEAARAAAAAAATVAATVAGTVAGTAPGSRRATHDGQDS